MNIPKAYVSKPLNNFKINNYYDNRYKTNSYLQQNTQKQIQLNKQIVEQKLDLEYNIDFLGRALSKAEIYALRFGNSKEKNKIKPLFGFYNRFNNGYEFEKKKLFKSLINAVKLLDYGLEETEYKYNEVLFPNNMTKENVIEYIESLKSCLCENEQSIYNDLINVIKRLNTDYSKYQKLYEESPKINPKEIMSSFPKINKVFEAKESKWRKNIENNPNYQPGLVLNKNYEDDEDFENVDKDNYE